MRTLPCIFTTGPAQPVMIIGRSCHRRHGIDFAFLYLIGYNKNIEVRQTDKYSEWFAALRDGQARARINARIRRLR